LHAQKIETELVSGNRSARHSVTPPTPIEVLILALLAGQRELVAEVRGLRADVAARKSVTDRLSISLSRVDVSLLGRLLPAIGGALGSDEFAVRELFERDSAALRLLLPGLTGIRIGRLFQRAEGQVIDGYLIERTGGRELNTALWRVVEVPGSALPVVPPREAR
jgi:hypothetical protein